MKIRVAILSGQDAGTNHDVVLERGQRLVIGRAHGCDLPLWDESASRRHAALEVGSDGTLLLSDLDSSNGTYIDGEKIGHRVLGTGTRVKIGETEFRIETEGFQDRKTVFLDAAARRETFTVQSSLDPDSVDLGRRMAADQDRGALLTQLLQLVDEVQDAEGGEAILALLLGKAAGALGANHVAAIPCASRSHTPLWNEALHHPTQQYSAQISRSVVERTLQEGNALLVTDVEQDPLTRDRKSIIGRSVGSILCAPIAARSRIHGALYAEASPEVGFSEEELAYLATLGQVAGMAMQNAERLQQSRRLLKTRDSATSQSEIITKSDELLKSIDMLGRFAASGGPVLIVGDTGTGKELMARRAHREGPYSSGPWIPVNCAAIPESLLESELFGHEKGAFTGATGRKAGMFELAHEGTLFLDEIGDMPIELQPKLLRVLESGEFFRIGGRSPLSVKLLVVSATHRNLAQRVEQGTFREDLYFRLNRFSVSIPPLAERPADTRLLARRFFEEAARKGNCSATDFADNAWDALLRYHWPGNVRELRNIIERAALVCAGEKITSADLGLSIVEIGAGLDRALGQPESPPPSLEVVEEKAIRNALRYTGGKKGEAAELLGIAWPTLRRKLKKYQIDPESP